MASGAELAMILRAKDEASPIFDKVKSSAGGLSSGMSSMMGGLALAGGAVTGVLAIGSAITSVASSMVSGNVEMETYQTQLGTLLGGADAAKTRIQELAKIGAETPFDLPQLVAAEKIMAGFGLTTEKTQQLTGRSLDQYRMAIGDMAAATGAPLDEVTLLWSKFGSGATGEAISRLQELGIVTREQMAAMGVEFSKSGELVTPIPEAMKIAMDLANEKMGGGMKALSSTFAGQMSTLSDNFGQAKVLLMAPIFDVLKDGLTGLNEMLSSETFTTALKSMAEAGAAGIQTLITAFGGLAEVFKTGEISEELDALLTNLFPVDVANGIIDIVSNLGLVFESVMGGDIPGILDGLIGIIEGFGSIIVGAVESWATAFASWVDGAESGQMTQMAELAQNLLGWLILTASLIVERLAIWGAAFIDWIGPKIPGMLAELGGYLASMTGWILGTGLPFIIGKLAEWGLAFVEWVAPRIPPLLAALGGLLLQLAGWLAGTALPAIVAKLLEWAEAFVAWVPGAIVRLLLAIGQMEIQLIAWIGGAVVGLAAKLLEWVAAFVAWPIIAAGQLPGKLAEIISAITGWISGAVGAIGTAAAEIGTAIVNGIAQAIRNGVGAITSAARGAAQSALDSAKAALGIESPSRVFNIEVGQQIVRGLIQGVDAMAGPLDQRMTGLVRPPTLQPSFAGAGFGGGFGGGGGPGVTVNVYAGNLVHERDVPSFVAQGLDQALRQGAGFGRGR